METCPKCSDLQECGKGFPTRDCKMCGGLGEIERSNPMPDRAVVGGDRHFHWSNAVAEMNPEDQADWIASVAGDDDAAVIARMKNMKPRALVAVSDDRQWLVVQELGGWIVYKRTMAGYDTYTDAFRPCADAGEDTGQDAQTVLDSFLAARD